MEIDAFDAVGDSRENFVGDGVDDVAEDSDRQVLAKDLHLITLLTRDVGDIDHRYIHTEITHILSFLTMHQAVAMTIAKVTVQSVGITDRYGGNHRVSLDFAFTTVAHSITCRHMAELEDRGFERGDAP